MIKILLAQNNSKSKHFKSEDILTKEDMLPTSFEPQPLRYYDGKLLWRSSDFELTLFDVVGKSVAVTELLSPKAPKFGYIPLTPNWKDRLEMGASCIKKEWRIK